MKSHITKLYSRWMSLGYCTRFLANHGKLVGTLVCNVNFKFDMT